MITTDEVLVALDKPRTIYSLKNLVDPSGRTIEALHALLMRMRAEKKVKFNIKNGTWRKVQRENHH